MRRPRAAVPRKSIRKKQRVPKQSSAEKFQKGVTTPTVVVDAERQETQLLAPFTGGTMVFFADRVELCGVNFCGGPRSQTKRKVLDHLRKMRADGAFEAYSGEQLAELLGLKGGENSAAGVIRDLRDDIVERLAAARNISCGRKDVILSGGIGYRFSKKLTVHSGDRPKITDINEESGVGDVGDPNGGDVGGDLAVIRQDWILRQLAEGRKLRAPAIARHFGCSIRTVERDLTALKKRGQIKFVGAARTGFYRPNETAETTKD